MRSRSDLHGYQEKAVGFVVDRPSCALWLSMGIGKTVITLTALADLLDSFDTHRVLIVAPLRVARATWPQELRAWTHVQHMRATVLAGRTPKARARLALRDTNDIHVINRELVPWLVDLFRETKTPWPYDTVVLDEASGFKSHRAARFKALRKVRPRIARMIQLTGTPTSGGLLDLWAQAFLLDGGERLGRAYTSFRDRYFVGDYMGYNFEPRANAEEQIHGALRDVVLSLSADDYLDVPPMLFNDVRVELPANARKAYGTLERDFLVTIEDETVAAVTAGVLAGKLLQCANGAFYTDPDGTWVGVHDAKLAALDEIVEGTCGAPLLVAYQFKSDVARIKTRYPSAELLGKDPRQIERWNRGEIAMLLAHPASAGHGLNLQHGGRHAVWFGLNWSLELYQQFNARLHRQGQAEPVIIHRIVADDTIDDAVIGALSAKGSTQRTLLEALKHEASSRAAEACAA
ncbi:MAG: DEAD/DEAH box helicase [Devosia sp.]